MKIKFVLESIGIDIIYKIGDTADLGENRNKSAVERKRAEWIVQPIKKNKKK